MIILKLRARNQEEITLQSVIITLQSVTMKINNSTLHPRSGMWIPIYNYLYQKIHICIYLEIKTIDQPTPRYSL